MVEAKRVLVVGIAGVGKTTVLNRVKEILKEKDLKVESLTYGTLMLEEAERLHKVKDRDELRKLKLQEQRELQISAAKKISKANSDIVLIDTHLLIKSGNIYLPGLPFDVIKKLKPKLIILIEAPAKEILKRRKKDSSRKRETLSKRAIEEELKMERELLGTCATLAGAPMLRVMNRENEVDKAAKIIGESLINL
ncbi:MAG: adenylate kinase [Nitrososphaerales archaeon]